jgi:hypothetical protein
VWTWQSKCRWMCLANIFNCVGESSTTNTFV